MSENKKLEFKNDGELYDESLTRKTPLEAFNLYHSIINVLINFDFVTIYDVVVSISKFPRPQNWIYASTHGWSRMDVTKFTIRKLDDGRWSVFLGNPRVIFDDRRGDNG